MKKNLLIILIVSLFIPHFVLAAWWNPLSWFGLSIVRTPNIESRVSEEPMSKVEIQKTTSEQKISEDYSKINQIKDIPKVGAVPQVVSKPVPNVPVAPVNFPQSAVQSVDLNQARTDLIENLQRFQEIQQIVSQNGYSNMNALSGRDYYKASTLSNINQRIGSMIYDLRNSNLKSESIENYKNKYSELQASYKSLGLVLIPRDSIISSRIPLEGSPACISARTAKDVADDALNNEIRHINQRRTEIFGSGGLTTEQAQVQFSAEERASLTKQADLALIQMSATNNYSLACFGTVSPINSSYRPPVNTSCTGYGNNVSCVSY